MTIFSSYGIKVTVLVVCLDLVSNLVERFECGFALDGSEVSSLEKGVAVVNLSGYF